MKHITRRILIYYKVSNTLYKISYLTYQIDYKVCKILLYIVYMIFYSLGINSYDLIYILFII